MRPIFGCGKSFGTFGELLQGVLPNNRNFLVTFPVARYSHATLSCDDETELMVHPGHKKKALKLAKKILFHFNLPEVGKLSIDSQLAEGKGMASSSADLVATANAIKNAYNLTFSNNLLESFMAEIEPSDGVMYDGAISYYQSEVMLRSFLGSLPPMKILAVDEGGEVDTISFNAKRKLFSMREKNEYEILLKRMEIAVRKKSTRDIGEISTRSAIMNQRLKNNVLLNPMLKIKNSVDGLGVAIAHSGTMIGILFDEKNVMLDQQLKTGLQLLENLGLTAHIFESLSSFLVSDKQIRKLGII